MDEEVSVVLCSLCICLSKNCRSPATWHCGIHVNQCSGQQSPVNMDNTHSSFVVDSNMCLSETETRDHTPVKYIPIRT